MSADFTLDPVLHFPPGTVLKLYTRGGELYRDAEPPGTVVDTATVAANSTAYFDGLGWETDYWAAAKVGGVWKWVAITTRGIDPIPATYIDENEPPDMPAGALWIQPAADGTLSLWRAT